MTQKQIDAMVNALKSGCNSFGEGDGSDPGFEQRAYEKRAKELLEAVTPSVDEECFELLLRNGVKFVVEKGTPAGDFMEQMEAPKDTSTIPNHKHTWMLVENPPAGGWNYVCFCGQGRISEPQTFHRERLPEMEAPRANQPPPTEEPNLPGEILSRLRVLAR